MSEHSLVCSLRQTTEEIILQNTQEHCHIDSEKWGVKQSDSLWGVVEQLENFEDHERKFQKKWNN